MTIHNQFKDLGLSMSLVNALDSMGITVPTPIQRDAIPKFLSTQQDLIGIAHTGTGKTAAFGLPLLDRINRSHHGTQALILTPTRELTLQVANALRQFSETRPINVVSIVGGQGYSTQLSALKNNPTIVVGTPGRLIDHVKRKTLNLAHLTTLILDEADEMLNVGFLEDIQFIFKSANPEKRVLLFSATMSNQIEMLSRTMLKDPVKIQAKHDSETVSLIRHQMIMVNDRDKTETLCRVIEMAHDFYAMVFCQTKRDVEQVAGVLGRRGIRADYLHGDLSQPQREKILAEFRSKNIHVLVVTDVACRGIDIPALTHVINFGMPQDSESYTHRSGRTGRAGKSGEVITIVTPGESRRLLGMVKRSAIQIERMPIPGHDSVAQAKLNRFKEQITSAIASAGPDSQRVAEQLLEQNTPVNIIAGLIELGFRSTLKVGRPIAEPSTDSHHTDRNSRSPRRFGNQSSKSSSGRPNRSKFRRPSR